MSDLLRYESDGRSYSHKESVGHPVNDGLRFDFDCIKKGDRLRIGFSQHGDRIMRDAKVSAVRNMEWGRVVYFEKQQFRIVRAYGYQVEDPIRYYHTRYAMFAAFHGRPFGGSEIEVESIEIIYRRSGWL